LWLRLRPRLWRLVWILIPHQGSNLSDILLECILLFFPQLFLFSLKQWIVITIMTMTMRFLRLA
jgi:hypothetical protein